MGENELRKSGAGLVDPGSLIREFRFWIWQYALVDHEIQELSRIIRLIFLYELVVRHRGFVDSLLGTNWKWVNALSNSLENPGFKFSILESRVWNQYCPRK